ncbi:helix-turn-helix protein [Kineococcus xinjiangensis]|uniref:Helix-turn-helix protein n=1 Tax=Kineococcus xinjiangensis TaxID=512762 RepID=A0A2S6IC80_9ACTN|nr:helix-turn-helix protein [Kineococcus xinjiangensis]
MTNPGRDLPEDWWSTEDVAGYLGISTSTVRAYLARRQMPEPTRKIGRMALWRPDDVRDWAGQRPRAGIQRGSAEVTA